MRYSNKHGAVTFHPEGGLNMLHSVFGLLCLVLGLLGVVFWWGNFGFVLRGLIPLILIIVGLIAIASGFYRKNQDLASGDGKEHGAEDK
jgi:hypothetical protein